MVISVRLQLVKDDLSAASSLSFSDQYCDTAHLQNTPYNTKETLRAANRQLSKHHIFDSGVTASYDRMYSAYLLSMNLRLYR